MNDFANTSNSGILKDYYVDDSGKESKRHSPLMRALQKRSKKNRITFGDRNTK